MAPSRAPSAAGIVLPDLGAREQISLWPLILLMLIMGLASPFWMRAIDASGTQLADRPTVAAAPHVIVLSSATFAPPDDSASAKGGK